jgi:hypothetical protein
MNLFSPWILLLIIAGLILFFGLYILFYRKQRLQSADIRYLQKHWKEAQDLVSEHPDKAVLKADKLLDFALKKAGFEGSLGEKMKAAKAVFRDNNAVWSAHKLRNRIAHEIDIKVSTQQANTALKGFKKAFADLGVSL